MMRQRVPWQSLGSEVGYLGSNPAPLLKCRVVWARVSPPGTRGPGPHQGIWEVARVQSLDSHACHTAVMTGPLHTVACRPWSQVGMEPGGHGPGHGERPASC